MDNGADWLDRGMDMLDLKDPEFSRFGNISTLRELTSLIKNNRVVPFVGAGLSIDIYGSWGKALEHIMDGHVFGPDAVDVQDLIGSGHYEEAAGKIRGLLGVTSFQDQLVAVFGEHLITDEALKKMSVRYLPRLFPDALVVTTNFDKVLERAFLMEQHAFDEKVVLRHLTDWQAENVRRGSLHYLIKIHGCVSAPDEVVMTKSKYMGLYRENSKPFERLRDILNANKLLFIGCGLKEDRTVELMREVGLGGHYAILEMNGEAGDPAFQERKLFMSDQLHMHCIWYPKGEHHYVEDVLEYIYAELTGQLKEVTAVPVTAPRVKGELPPAQEAFPAAAPRTKNNPPPAQVVAPLEVSLSTAKPLVKNEIYTMGRWNCKPLEWLILDVQPDRALLIAKDCLLKAPYNEVYKYVTWEQCSLRNRLLPQLLAQIFDDAERDRVLLWKNTNPGNMQNNAPGGADTEDRLFLLSIDEATQYFPYDEARIARLSGDVVRWWLRSPGDDPIGAALVHNIGGIFISGNICSSEIAVRPAFWLKL